MNSKKEIETLFNYANGFTDNAKLEDNLITFEKKGYDFHMIYESKNNHNFFKIYISEIFTEEDEDMLNILSLFLFKKFDNNVNCVKLITINGRVHAVFEHMFYELENLTSDPVVWGVASLIAMHENVNKFIIHVRNQIEK